MNSGLRKYGMSVLTMPVLLGTACSTVYEGKYPRDAGWRSGTVLEVALGEHLTQAGQRDCRQYLPQERMANHTFATVRFVNRSRISTITVMLQNEIQIKPNDLVYINVADCNASVMPRTTP
ncbi:MAG: hypothetical protein JWN23_3037 [Rhodocyclales bacterium]|nr:hypothetical protein [Rhodocyclales bacterium]